MKYDPTSILTGIFILFLVSYILVSLFNYAYLRVAKKAEKIKVAKIFLSAAVVSLGWMVATVLAIWVAASLNILIFSIFALLLIFGFNFFLAEKLIGVTGKHRIIYSLLLAIIFNPGWLTVIGLL
jgi:hypothetical protein